MNGYYVRGGALYVDGVVGGKRYRRSTGLGVCQKNIAYVQKHGQKILEEMVAAEQNQPKDFATFGMAVLRSGANGRSVFYQREIESKFNREIAPFFNPVAFDEIKPLMVEQFQNKLAGRYAPVTVRKYMNIVRLVLNKARINELCERNPMEGVVALRGKKSQQREAYTQEEMHKIISSASGWFKSFLITAFGTGMRTGELLALKWSDVDFELGTIIVQRSMRHACLSETTKTKTDRTIDMLEIVENSLKALHVRRSSNEWVFPNKEGVPYTESKNILKYYFKPLLEKIGVKYKTLYVSRHSFISLMLNNGMDLMWVSNMAGHASSTTTLKYYAIFEKRDKSRLKAANSPLAQREAR